MADAPKTSRRDFLRGRAAVEALANTTAAIGTPEPASGQQQTAGAVALPQADRAGYLTTISRRAMACEFAVLLNAGQYTMGIEAALAALDLVEQLEAQLSVFRDNSEVSWLNRTASAAPVEVEPRLFELLALAKKIHDETGGAYDIATGPLTKLWGFYRRQGHVPDREELAHTMQHVGMQHVQLDHARQTMQYAVSDTEINLGSNGKGYALDRAAELLTAEKIENFLLHGGNSSVLARGRQGHNTASLGGELSNQDQTNAGWWVGLRHPLEPERRIGEVRLHNRALGTSGGGVQFFVHDGRRLGHILDPRTGWPAEGTLSTTVAATTGAEADALATAFYVMGPDKSLDYCRRHSGISAVMMTPAADSERVEITLWGLADGDIRLEADQSLSIRRVST